MRAVIPPHLPAIKPKCEKQKAIKMKRVKKADKVQGKQIAHASFTLEESDSIPAVTTTAHTIVRKRKCPKRP